MSILLDEKKDPIFSGVLYNSVNYTDKKTYGINYNPLKSLEEKTCSYYLQPGKYIINYEKCIINIDYKTISDPLVIDNKTDIHREIRLTIENDKLEILEKFLKESYKFYKNTVLNHKLVEEKINYYIWDDYWNNNKKKHKRDIKTLCFSNNLHFNLLNDIKKFRSSEEELEYRKYGIPYKFNILLEGYPGTGKTSLITSIASELNLNIGTISFDSEMTDRALLRALKLLPDNTILLLEDIDVLFKERKENDNCKSALSFSGLINTLDGMGSMDGLIIFMTTNFCDNLDAALKRPGRVDKRIHFDYCDRDQVELMYKKFIEDRYYNFEPFYSEIKLYKLTTAILQKYFFENRKEPDLIKNISNLKMSSKDHKFDGDHLNMYS